MGWNPIKFVKNVLDDFPIVGDVIGGAADFFGQSSANKANVKLAREQMQFQERMSATEMQRRTQDLLAAGLNPMLAGANQQGASSASGARAEVQNPAGRAIATAMALRSQRLQLENMTAQNRLLLAQRHNVDADTNLKFVTANNVATTTQKVESELYTIAQQFKNMVQQFDLTKEQIRNAQLTNNQLERMQPLAEQLQKIMIAGEQAGLTRKEMEARVISELEAARGAGGLGPMILDLLQKLKYIGDSK